MRVKLDENVPAICAMPIRSQGHDVLSIPDQSMGGWPDEEIWPAIQKEGRFLITQDGGFGDLRRYPPGSHHGILLLRPRKLHLAEILAFLQGVLSRVSLANLSGCLAVADPHGIRIRRSPGERDE